MFAPVTGRGGLQRCETSRIPHFPDSQLTDGAEAVRPCLPLFATPGMIPCTHLCSRLSQFQAHNAAGRIRSIEEGN
jgi:hypothetical protein